MKTKIADNKKIEPKKIDESKFLDFTHIFSYNAPPNAGLFNILNSENAPKHSGGYYSCRESFARRFSANTFGYHLPRLNQITNVKKMVKWAEKRLNSSNEEKSKFKIGKMRFGYILIVNCPWWATSELRRQILTALMRTAACNSNNNSPYQLISREDEYFYNNHLKNNLFKFLNGYTYSKKRLTFLDGWMTHFNQSYSSDYLVKDDPKKLKKV